MCMRICIVYEMNELRDEVTRCRWRRRLWWVIQYPGEQEWKMKEKKRKKKDFELQRASDS